MSAGALTPREIRPHDGVGEIRLGMLASECVGLFGQPRLERPSRPGKRIERTLLWSEPSLLVEVDRAERICGVEARTGAMVVLYRGVDVFGRPAHEILDLVSADDSPDLGDPEFPCSIVFLGLELAFWRPLMKVRQFPTAPLLAPIESVYLDGTGRLREVAAKRGAWPRKPA